MATTPAPTDVQLQARVAHLNIIQGVIGRMASYSSTLKNFSLTAAAAIIALTIDMGVLVLWYAALGVTVLFMILDAYYLAQERCFRAIYRTAATRPWSDATDLSIDHPGVTFKQVLAALTSSSVWLFYLPIALGIILLIWNAPYVPAKPA